MTTTQLQALFAAQANALKSYMHEQVFTMPLAKTNPVDMDARKKYRMVGTDKYIRKASWLADRLGIEDANGGNKPGPS